MNQLWAGSFAGKSRRTVRSCSSGEGQEGSERNGNLFQEYEQQAYDPDGSLSRRYEGDSETFRQDVREGKQPATDRGDRWNPQEDAICRSARMSPGQIEEERRQSGWNPYRGEEEPAADARPVHPGLQSDWNEESAAGISSAPTGTRAGQWAQPYPSQARCPYPLEAYGRAKEAYEEETETERDFRKLQSMYPDAAKRLLPYIEEECDRMEYEGSSMFAEYPDLTTVYRIRDRIYGQVKGQLEDALTEWEREAADEVFSMQYIPRRKPQGPDAADLIQVMLLQEMHRRRSRYRQYQKWL